MRRPVHTDESEPESQMWGRRYLAEFVGTYFLVLTIGCNVISDSVGTAISMGAALVALIYAVGPVSGAHLNPAVTTAVILRGLFQHQQDLAMTALYVPVQLLAGCSAGITYLLLRGKTFELEPIGRNSAQAAFTLEVLYTAALCYVVLGVTSSIKARHVSGLAIGFTTTSAAFAIGGISGCCLNPAVSLGAASSNNLLERSGVEILNFALYFFGPFLGSLLGLVLFAAVFPDGTAAVGAGAANP